MPEIEITSPSNRWIKLARSLHRRNQRYRERAVLVEGIRPVSEAISSDASIRVVLVDASIADDDETHELISSAERSGVLVHHVEHEVFAAAADTQTPQGIIAVVEMPASKTFEERSILDLALIVDQVRDPGNLGTMLRSALGAGADAVFVAPGTVDPWSPKVVRAGAGCHFHLGLANLDWSEMPPVLTNIPRYGAEADAPVSYDAIDWREPAALVIGNETKGLSAEAKAHVDGIVGIPLASKLESLNAGVAASVILFEAARQRREGTPQ